MTEKLYYRDAYIKEFEARVIEVAECEGGYATVLDKTAFFPEEGGQYADNGTIDGIRLSGVYEKAGVIYHVLPQKLNPGKSVYCVLDFEERFEKMQCHTAEHILSGLIHKHFGLNNVGFHLGAEDVTMDVSAPLTQEQLSMIERLANGVIFENVSVEQLFPKGEELHDMQYRSKLDLSDNVRIIRIGEYDSCACCAPHVRSTGEIGSVKILDAVKLRGGMRIFITAGVRAVKMYARMLDVLCEVSALTSTPKLEVADSVKKLIADKDEISAKFKEYRLGIMLERAESIEKTDKNAVIRLEGVGYEEMRAVANKACERVSGMLVILCGDGEQYKYLIASKTVNLRLEVSKINAALCGKGGGGENMVQGNFNVSIDRIREYFNP